MKVHNVPTGYIFTESLLDINKEYKKTEWLIVGDYGKEKNIKANFLNLTKPINGVSHSEINMSEKCVITISTQHGCIMNCNFCDVPKLQYAGNVSRDNLIYQIKEALLYALNQNKFNNNYIKRLNVHFARMGEPMFNFYTILDCLRIINNSFDEIPLTIETFHPVISTMMPKGIDSLDLRLQDWCSYKNIVKKGEAGLQLSINSTSNEQRNFQMRNGSLSLEKISKIAETLSYPIRRKYTLNFAVTKDTILEEKVLSSLFDKEKFIIKLTPIHETKSAIENNFNITNSYSNYSVYEKFEQPLVDAGWDVIVFVPSLEEDKSRITCGNALLSEIK